MKNTNPGMAILIHIVGEIESRDENDGSGKPEDQLDDCL